MPVLGSPQQESLAKILEPKESTKEAKNKSGIAISSKGGGTWENKWTTGTGIVLEVQGSGIKSSHTGEEEGVVGVVGWLVVE